MGNGQALMAALGGLVRAHGLDARARHAPIDQVDQLGQPGIGIAIADGLRKGKGLLGFEVSGEIRGAFLHCMTSLRASGKAHSLSGDEMLNEH